MSSTTVEFVRRVLREAEHGHGHGKRVLIFEPAATRRHYPLLFAVLGLELQVTKNAWRAHRFRGAGSCFSTLDSHYANASTTTEGYLVLPDCSPASVDLAVTAAHQSGGSVKGLVVASNTELFQLPAKLQEFFEARGCEVDSMVFAPSSSHASDAVPVEATLSSIFVLAGQSNMSGRGVPESLFSTGRTDRGGYSSFQHEIHKSVFQDLAEPSPHCYYDPVFGWTTLNPPVSILHKHVDLLKEAGIGIGNFFADDFARRLHHEDEARGHLVGLIPVAVGATALHEWMPEHVDDSFASRQAYHAGGSNLFSCALRSIYLALKQSRKSGGCCCPSVLGVLWYQGENDCTLGLEAARSYGTRFALFVYELRLAIEVLEEISSGAARRPPRVLPVVTTAITTTRGALLEHLCIVREQQLRVPEEEMEGITVVDACGVGLKADCIHLTSQSLALISGEMARQMVSLLRAPRRETAGLSPLVDPDVPVGTASFLDNHDQTPESVDGGFASVFVRARLSAIASAQIHLEGKSSSGELSSAAMKQSGLRAVNFVRGEVFFIDFLRVLRLAAPFMTTARDDVFVDLGCGVGSCLAAASCLTRPRFTHLCGLDLSRTKTLECSLLLSAMGVTQAVQVLKVDFLSGEVEWWREASVVYVCATCFAEDVWEPLYPLLALVQPDCLVVCVDKELPAADWQLLISVQVNSTWGLANAKVFKRTSSSSI